MRILIIMGGYFPGKKYGGPPVSVDNFCSLFKKDAECYIVTVNHDMNEKRVYNTIHGGWNERDNAQVLYLPDKDYCAKTFKKVFDEIRPDFLYLQGLFQKCVFPCLLLAKKRHTKVVLAPRGELCAGAFKKKYKKIPYIAMLRALRLLDNVVFQSTSEEESTAIERYLGSNKNKIYLLTNIPSLPPKLTERNQKQRGSARFVFISRILWKKNLLSALHYLKGIKSGSVVFDIYGPKEDNSYWLECEKAIKELPSNIVVNYMGLLSHDEVHKTFNLYDAFLFPTYSENYGHVIAEALVTGCIPIISDQTPWNDLTASKAGWALPLKDEKAFIKAIQDVVDMDNVKIKMIRNNISHYLENKLKLNITKAEYLKAFK